MKNPELFSLSDSELSQKRIVGALINNSTDLPGIIDVCACNGDHNAILFLACALSYRKKPEKTHYVYIVEWFISSMLDDSTNAMNEMDMPINGLAPETKAQTLLLIEKAKNIKLINPIPTIGTRSAFKNKLSSIFSSSKPKIANISGSDMDIIHAAGARQRRVAVFSENITMNIFDYLIDRAESDLDRNIPSNPTTGNVPAFSKFIPLFKRRVKAVSDAGFTIPQEFLDY